MLDVINEILSIDINDKVKFKIVNITYIREDKEYGKKSSSSKINNRCIVV